MRKPSIWILQGYKMKEEIDKPRTIHHIDPIIWRQFVGIAKIKDMKAGKLLNELIVVFMEKQKVIDNSPNKM